MKKSLWEYNFWKRYEFAWPIQLFYSYFHFTTKAKKKKKQKQFLLDQFFLLFCELVLKLHILLQGEEGLVSPVLHQSRVTF